MKIIFTGIIILFVSLFSHSYSEQTEEEEIRKTLPVTGNAEARRLLVDNINGSISITGYSGSEIEVIAHKTIRAESSDKFQEAKEKVTLEMSSEGDRVIVYVNAPWRDKDGCVNNRGWNYYGYDVDYDFELRVPEKMNIILKTINNGDITVKNIQGHFDVSNINGAVEMNNIAGDGSASTINGNVTITFTQNPGAVSSFKTINGKVDVQFRKNLSADLTMSTMNGEVYTDFDVKDVPRLHPIHKSNGRKNVFKSGDSFTVQTGGGGPELSFATLNGNIYIVSSEN